jgi:lipoate-protein ligase B
LGIVEYSDAWDIQLELVEAIKAGQSSNTLLLLQHPHVYTLGRRGDRDHVLLDDSQLEARGIALHEADRGGQVTYHGPGQLVAYPVVNLRSWGGPLRYVRPTKKSGAKIRK